MERREGREKHSRRARAVWLLRVLGLCHCHSNVLLQEGNLRGEWEMSTNGEQREKWYNWIWLRLSVRTGQDIICGWNYFDSVAMWMTLCEVGPVWGMRIVSCEICISMALGMAMSVAGSRVKYLTNCWLYIDVHIQDSCGTFRLVPPSNWHLCSCQLWQRLSLILIQIFMFSNGKNCNNLGASLTLHFEPLLAQF